jgi:crotonobetainyl-CoA hydratase
MSPSGGGDQRREGDPAVSVVEGASGVVLVRRVGAVLVIQINRPEARNAINTAAADGIGAAMEVAHSDPDIRCVILTGTGDRAFCAGADLKASRKGGSIPSEHPEWGFGGFARHQIDKPVIAAVNGVALGGGTELVLASDLAVACDWAEFGLPEVRRGRFAGQGGLFRLPSQVPWKLAMEMIFTGTPIRAETALALGLVNRLAASVDEMMELAMELAERIASNAPLAVQASKRLAYAARTGVLEQESLWSLTAAERDRLSESADWQEGVAAFAERRSPVWRGR